MTKKERSEKIRIAKKRGKEKRNGKHEKDKVTKMMDIPDLNTR